MRFMLGGSGALMLALALNAPASSQEIGRPAQGSISGRVVASGTRRPVPGVQVYLPATSLGTLTNLDGRYLLTSVPVGEVTIRVQMIGYGTLEETRMVAAGASVVVNFELSLEALALDGIVVTGTAGQARRREVGNTIVQLNLENITDRAANVDQLLQGQGPGITVTDGGGALGQGARIRLRGVSSISMGNQPLIYVDGVRISQNYPNQAPLDGTAARQAWVHVSPLNEINPSDIDRVEVIKGAAAATLYGTEAAAGVVQIFTKKGRAGAAKWDAQVDVGADKMWKFGPPIEPFMRSEPILRTGVRQRYQLSVQGGVEAVQYFLSAGYTDRTGNLPTEAQEQLNLRSNLTFTPAKHLYIEYNTSYTRNDLQLAPQSNNSQGYTFQAFMDRGSPLGVNWRDQVHLIDEWEITMDNSHVITGLTARHAPTDWLETRVTVGIDRVDSEGRNVRPFGFVMQPTGVVNNTRFTEQHTTLDYVSNFSFDLTPELKTTFSVGGQYVRDAKATVQAYSDNLPGPGIPTVSSGARRLSSEDRQTVNTGGGFLQALMGYRDRYFLTVGVRIDGNSAFGSDFGLQAYPKASASYVVSDEAFWPKTLGDLKVRAAYGHAGRAPGAFDALRTWAPVGWGGLPAFFPQNTGNPNLGPERKTEWEVGFDSGLFGGRLSTEVTYYHATIEDALLPVQLIPSLGFFPVQAGGSVPTQQLENIGRFENKGLELGVNAIALDRPWGTWEVGVTYTSNRSNVLDLGAAERYSVGGGAFVEVGHPLPAIQGSKLLNPDAIAEPQFSTPSLVGPAAPTRIVGVNTSLNLPRGITLSARGEYVGGHWLNYSGWDFQVSRGGWPECEERAFEYIAAGRRNELTAYERTMCVSSLSRPPGLFAEPATFFKLREVALSVRVPSRILQDGVLTLSARNALRWFNKDWTWNDPEVGGRNAGDLNSVAQALADSSLPAPVQYSASFRVRF
ncbi:MAG: TonB-dependent receptor [Gemmatimonadetes bacterium]|nr:TonB-dependent receptor [Gemmatimonadota bacterium]